MGYEAPFAAAEAGDFGETEHLLIWAWRRLAADRDSVPSLMMRFAQICGEEGPELLLTLCVFVDALTYASPRPPVLGAPGCATITADERQTLTLLAAIQADRPARLEAQLCWATLPERRSIVEIAANALVGALHANNLGIMPPARVPATQCERPRFAA